MGRLLLLVLLSVLISCSGLKQSGSAINEDELLHTRKFIGNYIECFHTGPDIYGGLDLIWIKTTLYPDFGQLSVYGRNCEFSSGDRIYLRSRYLSDGSFGNWEYLVENESSVSYRLSEYRSGDKVLVQRMLR